MLTHKSKRGTRSQAEDLVLTTITQHADALLRTARRHSLCADDASDAYQRALEIFLRNAGAPGPRSRSELAAHGRQARGDGRACARGSGSSAPRSSTATRSRPSTRRRRTSRLLAFEDVTRAAEALQGLKPQEVRALWLRMEGRTYKEIAEELDWTYTKVNRCVTEGRRAFLDALRRHRGGRGVPPLRVRALRLRRRGAARRRDRRAAPPPARLRRVSRRRCAACAAATARSARSCRSASPSAASTAATPHSASSSASTRRSSAISRSAPSRSRRRRRSPRRRRAC